MGLIQGAKGAKPPPNLIIGKRHYTGKGSVIDSFFPTHARFFDGIREAIAKTEAAGIGGARMDLEEALNGCERHFRQTHRSGGRVIFIGNGGSAAIASHMAVDYTKNGGVRSMAMNDAPMLTCLANDFGYEEAFAKQLEQQATRRDTVVIVSSSGKSPNVLRAADAAREIGVSLVVTLTGMNPNNLLRAKGDRAFYVPCVDYGVVEIAHLALLHSMVGR